MKKIALITSSDHLALDFDMPLLVAACKESKIDVTICDWESNNIDWSYFDALILRSPWNYIDKTTKFLYWCEHVSNITRLLNPFSVCKWSLNKNYLEWLSYNGIPTVPFLVLKRNTKFSQDFSLFIENFLEANIDDIVLKPNIGAYSKNVKRFKMAETSSMLDYINELHEQNFDVIAQPYMKSIDQFGESNLTFFNNIYSHAIKKSALLNEDKEAGFPTQGSRKPYEAEDEEKTIALKALTMVSKTLNDGEPLLYSRIDLVKDSTGRSVILELELCEPSLNLPFSKKSAKTFAEAIASKIV